MATFVLVHGAWHGGWCWSRVAPLLRAAGHEVFTPTLAGLGEQAHRATPDIRLDTHIDDVIGLIEAEELEQVILCGHSYAGLVVTGVADRMTERISTLIFLDAFVPEDGRSMFSYYPPEKALERLTQVGQTGDGWKVDPMSPEYFGVLRAEDADWIRRRCVPHPVLTQLQAISLTGSWETVPLKAYIQAGKHPQPTFKEFADKYQDAPGWQFYSLPCGHEIMIDMPAELAEIYLELAG